MRILRALLLVLLLAGAANAALKFPELTGRVVDGAHILSSSTKDSLDILLGDHESKSTDQVVVAIIPTLQGDAIEDYGYQLGRYWGIGQKGKNNGVILIVAPVEHKVRIEVGYGLEGTLTDAICSQIIHNIILPDFKSGQMETGIIEGTTAIISVLEGHAASLPEATYSKHNQQDMPTWLVIVLLLGFFGFRIFMFRRYGIFIGGGSYSSGGSFGSSGGFSGGGGSFGGGGASGSW